MSEGAKYKLILKALEVAHAPKNVTSVVLKATCNRKAKETGKAAVSGGAATWDTDNTLAKLSLRTRDKEPCELVLVNALTNAALGTVEVDIMEYVAKVPPGGRPKKFKVEKKLAKSDTTVKLQLSISMDEDEEGSKTPSKKSAGDKKEKRKSTASEREVVVGVTPPSPLQKLKIPSKAATFTSRQLVDGAEGSRSQSMMTPGMSPRTAARIGGETDSPRGRSVNRLVQAGSSPFASPSRPNKYNTLASAAPTNHKSESEPVLNRSADAPKSPGVNRSGSSRPTTPGYSQASKYPTLGSGSAGGKGAGGARPSRGGHRRSQSNEVVLSDADDLKQRYAVERQEADEKFLIDTVIGGPTMPSEPHVLAYIVYQSLLQWHAFDENPAIISRVVSAIEQAIHTSEESRTMLFAWISNTITLRYLAHEDRKRNTSEELEQIFAQFEDDMFVQAAAAFESALRHLQKKLDPLLQPCFKEALLAPAGSERVLQDAKSGALATIFNTLMDYVKLIQDYGVFDTVRHHFHLRIFHYITVRIIQATLMEALVDGGNSFSQGIQLKMMVTQFEEWARNKAGAPLAKVAEKALDPAREAANVVCFPTKKELAGETIRKEVCPSLRPAQIAKLLENYRADVFDSAPVPSELVAQLLAQDKAYKVTDATFEADEVAPLPFELSMSAIDLSLIQLPKAVLDRPGFAFLKDGALTFQSLHAEEEKW